MTFIAGLTFAPRSARADDAAAAGVTAASADTSAADTSTDTSDLEGLLSESVVVTASKTPERDSVAPATSRVITADEMRRYGLRTVDEALAFMVPGVFESGNGSPAARGVTVTNGLSSEGRFLLMVNGHMVNDPYRSTASFGWGSPTPMELVDRIEVIMGPGSVLYGSNAVLGVIHVFTKDGKSFPGARVGVDSEIGVAVRPWVGFGHEFKIFGAPADVALQLEYYRRDGPRLYLPPRIVGDDPQTGRPTRFTRSLDGTGVWGGDYFYQRDDVPRGHMRLHVGGFTLNVFAGISRGGLPLSIPADFRPKGWSNEQRRLSLDLSHRLTISKTVQLTSRIYADTVDERPTFETSRSPICQFPDRLTCMIESTSGSRWGGVEIQPQFDWFADGSFVTTIGVDARARQVTAKTDTKDASTERSLIPSIAIIDQSDVTVGAYGQQTWLPARWVALNAGARLDYDQRFDPVVSPRGAVAFEVWRGGRLKVMSSQAFRAPTFEDSYFSHPLQPVSQDLGPERVWSREVAFTQNVGAQTLSVVAFNSTWQGLIQRHQFTPQEASEYVASGKSLFPPEYQIRNIGTIDNYGFTAGIEGRALSSTLTYGTNFTGAVAKTTGENGVNTPLESSPRWYGNSHISYGVPGVIPIIGLAAHYVGKIAMPGAFSGTFSRIPYAPPQLNMRLTATGDIGAIKGLSYRVSGDYSFSGGTALAIGPVSAETALYDAPLRKPVDRFRYTVGLQYVF